MVDFFDDGGVEALGCLVVRCGVVAFERLVEGRMFLVLLSWSFFIGLEMPWMGCCAQSMLTGKTRWMTVPKVWEQIR